MRKFWQVAMNDDGTHYAVPPDDIWIMEVPFGNVPAYDQLADGGWVSAGHGTRDYWLLAHVDLKGWKS